MAFNTDPPAGTRPAPGGERHIVGTPGGGGPHSKALWVPFEGVVFPPQRIVGNLAGGGGGVLQRIVGNIWGGVALLVGRYCRYPQRRGLLLPQSIMGSPLAW